MRHVALLLVTGFLACSAFESGDAPSEAPPPNGGGGGTEAGPNVEVEGGAGPDAGPDVDPKPALTFVDAVSQIPGLVAYFHLDEGGSGTLTDVKGGNSGTFQPTLTPAAGLLPGDGDARATRFATGAISVASGDLSSLRTFDQALTVGALVRADQLSGDQVVVFKYNLFTLGITGDGHAFLDVQRGPSLVRFLSNATLPADATALIVGTFDLASKSISLSVNHKATASLGPPALGIGSSANTSSLCIGGAAAGATGTDCRVGFRFIGTIDEVFLANQAVPSGTVDQLATLAGL